MTLRGAFFLSHKSGAEPHLSAWWFTSISALWRVGESRPPIQSESYFRCKDSLLCRSDMDYIVKQMLQTLSMAIQTAISISAAANRRCWVNEEESLSARFPHIGCRVGLMSVNTATHAETHMEAFTRGLSHSHARCVTGLLAPRAPLQTRRVLRGRRSWAAPNRWENN